MKQCILCGEKFQPKKYGWTRKYCYNCVPQETSTFSHADAITAKRRAIKKALINMKGGKCSICGYNRCIQALEFHHLDPTKKEIGLSKNLSTDFQKLKKQVEKCILVCANCHREIHSQLIDISSNLK